MAFDRSRTGLDGLNFFLAAVQTGFGPFVSVFLTEYGWSQTDIGFALSIGTIAAMAGQLPAGVLLDMLHSKRIATAVALLLTGMSALTLALWPARLPVFASETLHGLAGCVLGQAIASITLALVGHGDFGERVGHNARFASFGSAAAAALLGAFSSYVSARAVLVLTAGLTLPAIAALALIRPADLIRPEAAADHAANLHPKVRRGRRHRSWHVFLERGLLAFAAVAALFQLANAAMLPLALNELAKRVGHAPGLVVSAAIIVPQIIVAAASPWVGRAAQRRGRRPLLLIGCIALPIRSLLFAAFPGPVALILAESLDGLGAAVFGVMVPLIAADVSRRTGSLNLAMGVIGLAVGIGATLSTTVAGVIADGLGPRIAFLSLAAAGTSAALLVWLVMPETKPASSDGREFPPAAPPDPAPDPAR